MIAMDSTRITGHSVFSKSIVAMVTRTPLNYKCLLEEGGKKEVPVDIYI